MGDLNHSRSGIQPTSQRYCVQRILSAMQQLGDRFRPFSAVHCKKWRVKNILLHITTYYYRYVSTVLLPHYYKITLKLLPHYYNNTTILLHHYYILLQNYYIITTKYYLITTQLLPYYYYITTYYYILLHHYYTLLLYYYLIITILLPYFYQITT